MKRRKEREIIVLSLYSMELSGNSINDTVSYVLEQNKTTEEATDYIYTSLQGIIANKEKIDEIITNNLENYTIGRLSLLDLAIIRFATYELMEENEIPFAIIINEAIEITRKYSDIGDNKAIAFNNRLLDNIKASIKG